MKPLRIEWDDDYGIDHRRGWSITYDGRVVVELEPNLLRAIKRFLKDKPWEPLCYGCADVISGYPLVRPVRVHEPGLQGPGRIFHAECAPRCERCNERVTGPVVAVQEWNGWRSAGELDAEVGYWGKSRLYHPWCAPPIATETRTEV